MSESILINYLLYHVQKDSLMKFRINENENENENETKILPPIVQ
jgi:hypothetical protein